MAIRWLVLVVVLAGPAAGLFSPLRVGRVHAAPDIAAALQEADRRAWLTDWSAALPLYTEAEAAARAVGDQRRTLYAKCGRLRGEMQIRSLGDISDEIARDLARPVVQRDPQLRLRGVTVKGDIDLEWDVQRRGATGNRRVNWQWTSATRVGRTVPPASWA